MLKVRSTIPVQKLVSIIVVSLIAVAGCSKKGDDDQSVGPGAKIEVAPTSQTRTPEVPDNTAVLSDRGEAPVVENEGTNGEENEEPQIVDSIATSVNDAPVEPPEANTTPNPELPSGATVTAAPEHGGGFVVQPQPAELPNVAPVESGTVGHPPVGRSGDSSGARETISNAPEPEPRSSGPGPVTGAAEPIAGPASNPTVPVIPAAVVPAQPVQEPLRFEMEYGCVYNSSTPVLYPQVAPLDQRNPLLKLNSETGQPESFLPCAVLTLGDMQSRLSPEIIRLPGSLAALNFEFDSDISIPSRRRQIQAIAQYLFRGRDLRWANLSRLNGTGINFLGANLTRAALPRICVNCNFSRSQMREARAWRSDIAPSNSNSMERFELNFTGSNFSHADLRRLVFYAGTNLLNSNFQCARFDANTFPRSGAQLQGARFSEVRVRQAANRSTTFEELKTRLETAGAIIELESASTGRGQCGSNSRRTRSSSVVRTAQSPREPTRFGR